MNSIFSILPFARYTIATPSPVAIFGFVVVLYACPQPPLASKVILEIIFSEFEFKNEVTECDFSHEPFNDNDLLIPIWRVDNNI